jgi:hypothetical protein
MTRGHLTRSPSGHLTRQAGRSPDSASGSTFTLADGLADYLVSGRARGLSPKTLDWYRMVGERFAAFRTDLVGRLVEPRSRLPDGDDVGAGVRQRSGNLAADPATRAGDESNPVCQIER